MRPGRRGAAPDVGDIEGNAGRTSLHRMTPGSCGASPVYVFVDVEGDAESTSALLDIGKLWYCPIIDVLSATPEDQRA
jgi:hypothetical protein